MLNLIGFASLRYAVIRSKSRRIRQFAGLEKPRCKEVSGDRVFLATEKDILYFVDWTGLDWTGLVRTGLDWTSKTRTSKTRTCKTWTSKTWTSKTRTCKTRTCKTRTSKNEMKKMLFKYSKNKTPKYCLY